MVRKGVRVHQLAYNVVCDQMTQVAREAGLLPVQLGFKVRCKGLMPSPAGWGRPEPRR